MAIKRVRIRPQAHTERKALECVQHRLDAIAEAALKEGQEAPVPHIVGLLTSYTTVVQGRKHMNLVTR